MIGIERNRSNSIERYRVFRFLSIFIESLFLYSPPTKLHYPKSNSDRFRSIFSLVGRGWKNRGWNRSKSIDTHRVHRFLSIFIGSLYFHPSPTTLHYTLNRSESIGVDRQASFFYRFLTIIISLFISSPFLCRIASILIDFH